MNPIVEVVAKALFALESDKWLRQAPKWSGLAEMRKQALREKVEDELLAAMNAGYVLTRAPVLERKGPE